MSFKVCSTCKLSLSEDNFYKEKRKNGETYLRSKCKACDKIVRSKRVQEKKLYDQLKFIENKDAIVERNNKWKENNKEHSREYKKIYEREKRKNMSDSDKLKDKLRLRIYKNIKKNKLTTEYLDTTIENVKNWLEHNFKDDMNWSNSGKIWHIDHTIPIDVFDLSKDDDVFICFNWRNLMPRYAKENISKKNKIISKLILDQEIICKKYCNDDNTKIYFNKYMVFYNQICNTFKMQGTP